MAALSLLATLSLQPAGTAELVTVRELLDAAIAFHDPESLWGTAPLDLTFEETRPDDPARTTEVAIDIAAERFSWSTTRGGHRLFGELAGTKCETRLDGGAEFSDGARQEHRLTCGQVGRRRDYYTYLWGLPMKLRDPGTRLAEEVEIAEFQGQRVLELGVTYDKDVGSDTWYFYFDPESSALRGYRFFHDEGENDGEYIVLDDLAAVGGIRLPKTRAWYTNEGDIYLGTDTLIAREQASDDSNREH